ncbi:unnamed protein product [Cuscuta epithymum]|nr:unnamed protein product [Cuscuta epithymum]CAH9136329.1 unnamed protein product [Cuscuta epithymum]
MFNALNSVEHIFSANCRIQVQKGNNSFWYDNWCDIGPLYQYREDIPTALGNITIKYAMSGKTLNPQVRNCLPRYVIDNIHAMNIRFTDQEDNYIWQPCSDGNFSFSSAYDVIRPKKTLLPLAKYIWNNRIPKKNSFFLWRLTNNLLPFEDKLTQFGIFGPFKCPLCLNEDSIDHFFLDCNFSSNIWQHFETVLNFPSFKRTTFSNYITKWYKGYKSHIKDLNYIVPNIITWQLWKIRNNYLYDDKKANFSEAIKAIKNDIFVMSVANPLIAHGPNVPFNIHTIFPKKTAQPTISYWTKPPPTYLKINIAARILTPTLNRTAALIRDEKGNYFGHATHLSNKTHITFALYDAILYFIQFFKNSHLNNVVLEIDNREVYEGITGLSLHHWKY